MKKILFSLMLLVMGTSSAQVMPNDVTVRQRRADDLGYLDRFIGFPGSGASCLFSLDGPTVLPNCYLIGSGLTLSGGILSVSAGGGQMQADWLQSNAASVDYIKNKPTLATVAASGSYSDLTGRPTLFSGAYADLTGKPSFATVATSGNYADLSGKPTIPTVTAFNFSQPTVRSLAVSTSYQALDNTKAAVIVPSYACQNATQVLASSACTIQVRMGTGTLTCSTGTVYYTQRLAVSLGVLITQDSTNPVQINLPIGGSFIMCPVAGTFTISAVEQTAG